jgi:tetratricopeptide (TPR) repeat protein
MYPLAITLRTRSIARYPGVSAAVCCVLAVWLPACVVSGCGAHPDVVACQRAADQRVASASELCERAWRATGSEAAAVAGAIYALSRRDDATLKRWAQRARSTIEGARILHFWGDRQRMLGDLEGAEDTLRRALGIRVDRDPARATNTALALLELVQSRRPAEETIQLARLAWDQAKRAGQPLSHAFAAEALAGILIDLGELGAAEAVIRRMDPADSRVLKDVAEGNLRAAQGLLELAAALFKRASVPSATDPGRSWPLNGRIALVRALLEVGRVRDARAALDDTLALALRRGTGALNTACRLYAAEGAVLVAEGNIDGALASVQRGLATSSRDAARVQLLNVRGDALARRGDADGAEQAWREAADHVELWRASIPSTELRAELVAHHRHALEAWLDSTAMRGNIAAALEVTSRVAGRALLDRMRRGDAGRSHTRLPAPAARPTMAAWLSAEANASIDEVVRKLAANRDLAARTRPAPDLLRVEHDMVALMFGARWTWAIRRVRGSWSIDRVGDRASILAQVDDYRRSLDDPEIAARLGGALFPPETLPTKDAPLVVLLDRQLADVALPGLRTGGKFLVEYAPILEPLAPELALAPVPAHSWDPAVVIGDPTGDLPDAVREAGLVARALSVEPRLGRAATRDTVTRAARARVLHVAAHSTIRAGEAALVLSDGTLSSLEIVNQGIAPRVAVIATCRSQVDDDPATSLAAALLAAGAAGVIGIKRALDDRDGAFLMHELYRAGVAGNPLRALARTQRLAIASHRPPHTWATVSFFGVGGWILTQE